jgi:hypothetical protein
LEPGLQAKPCRRCFSTYRLLTWQYSQVLCS